MAEAQIVGSILGTAIGDSVGLPYEGLSRRRAGRLLGPPDRHRFFFGRGMVSDDTEHTCMVAQSLIASGGDPDVFGRQLAWGFRLWVLGLPAGDRVCHAARHPQALVRRGSREERGPFPPGTVPR